HLFGEFEDLVERILAVFAEGIERAEVAAREIAVDAEILVIASLLERAVSVAVAGIRLDLAPGGGLVEGLDCLRVEPDAVPQGLAPASQEGDCGDRAGFGIDL